MTPPIGPEIDGLLFLQHLGTGGYSDVYLYERRSPRMRVAVKILRDGRLSAPELAQFEAEAETMAELADHPNIVQVFNADKTADGRPYLVMKYYPNVNLGDRAGAERFSVAEVLRTGIKIASAVETAHRADIVHRDIKPANILVDRHGEPGLTDFGIAGRAGELDDGEDLGVSIPWSPPEVLSGQSNGSVSSDVYSLGATLWHLLVGRSPFQTLGGRDGQHQLVNRVLRTPAPPTGRADVPAGLERLLAQTMAKDPAARPRSALELAQGLQSIEQQQRLQPTKIVVDGVAAAQPPPSRRDPEDGTRIKGPTRVIAQAPVAAPVRRAPDADAEPPTRARPATSVPGDVRPRRHPLEPAAGSTVHRPHSAAAKADQRPAAEERRSLRPRSIAYAAAAFVGVAAVVGALLASGGDASPQHSTVSTPPADDQASSLAEAPKPVVRASYDRARRTVTFTWSVPHGSVGEFYYELSNPDQTKVVMGRELPVKSTDPTHTCIRVTFLDHKLEKKSAQSDLVCGPR